MSGEPAPDAEGREGHPVSRMALCARHARDPDCAGCPLRAWRGAPCGRQPDGPDAWERCTRDPRSMIGALNAWRAALDREPAPPRGGASPAPVSRDTGPEP